MTRCRLSRLEKELNQIGGESKLDNGIQPSARLHQVTLPKSLPKPDQWDSGVVATS
jgi:hypothetical protein